MKKIITVFVLASSLNAMAAQKVCNILVQDNNITQDTEHLGWGFLRFTAQKEGATVHSCFPEESGPAMVAVYPNGEVRAILF